MCSCHVKSTAWDTVVDPGSPRGPQEPGPPLLLLKLVKKDGRRTAPKFRELSGPSRTNFWIRCWDNKLILYCNTGKLVDAGLFHDEDVDRYYTPGEDADVTGLCSVGSKHPHMA